MSQLNPNQIAALLKADEKAPKRGGGRAKKDVTEPRTVQQWFSSEMPHKVANFFDEAGNEIVPHCENPNCLDPRPENDRGRHVVAFVKGKMTCRFCFLDGWLSDAQQTTN